MMMKDYRSTNFLLLCLKYKEEFIPQVVFQELSPPYIPSTDNLFNPSARNLYTISDAQKSP